MGLYYTSADIERTESVDIEIVHIETADIETVDIKSVAIESADIAELTKRSGAGWH